MEQIPQPEFKQQIQQTEPTQFKTFVADISSYR